MSAKQVACDCGKVIREQTDDDLVTAVQKHAREVHEMEMTREQVLSMAEPREAPANRGATEGIGRASVGAGAGARAVPRFRPPDPRGRGAD